MGLAALLALTIAGGAALAVNEIGTNGPDRLIGTDKEDTLSGRGGDDYLQGRGAADMLKGNDGGDDVVGGKGRDYLSGARGKDTLLGNRGNDRIDADDGYRDYINCGKGEEDKVVIDKKDFTKNCEFHNGVRTEPDENGEFDPHHGDQIWEVEAKPNAEEVPDEE
jgi:Ca2+-binding RTX toxin-like protein